MTINGVGDYLDKLNELSGKASTAIIKEGVFEGAAVVADAIREEIEKLPRMKKENGFLDGVTESQRKGLLDGLTLLDMQYERGLIFTKIAFVGYNSSKTKKWKNGQPNAMIARSVEKGTSFMQAHPFRKKAIAAVKDRAVAEIGKKIDLEISKIFS